MKTPAIFDGKSRLEITTELGGYGSGDLMFTACAAFLDMQEHWGEQSGSHRPSDSALPMATKAALTDVLLIGMVIGMRRAHGTAAPLALMDMAGIDEAEAQEILAAWIDGPGGGRRAPDSDELANGPTEVDLAAADLALSGDASDPRVFYALVLALAGTAVAVFNQIKDLPQEERTANGDVVATLRAALDVLADEQARRND